MSSESNHSMSQDSLSTTPEKADTKTPEKSSSTSSNRDSSPGRKRLYYSPSTPSSSHSQSSSHSSPAKQSANLQDLTGYITNVTQSVMSKHTGNEYFDVHLKTSPNEQSIIRVMKKHNRSIKRSFFLDARQIPVRLTKLTQGDNVLFYNSIYKFSTVIKEHVTTNFNYEDNLFTPISTIISNEMGTFNVKGAFAWIKDETVVEKKDKSNERARDGVIVETTTSSISVTVWGKMIDKITTEKAVYEFTQLKLKTLWSYPKLDVTDTSTIEIDASAVTDVNWNAVDMLDWDKIEKAHKDKFFPTIVASIIGCSVDLFPTCVHCKKKITVPPNQKSFSCQLCGGRLLISKLPLGFVGNVQLENNDDDPLSLTFFPEVLHPFLGKNFLHFEKEDIEDKILELSDMVEITYSKNKRTITKITELEEEVDLI
ncbi:uncharacterized protein [Clytia hemisphaerica]|uniref:uncharacterized protein n=1 Tax=Clytia hemisphaerica TaxID=252671 RepID=UPI0034D621CA